MHICTLYTHVCIYMCIYVCVCVYLYLYLSTYLYELEVSALRFQFKNLEKVQQMKSKVGEMNNKQKSVTYKTSI